MKDFFKYLFCILTICILNSHAHAAIVTNGLVARYDAANASSNNGSGTSLYNLQCTGYATLYNNPSYTGGGNPYFSFNEGNQYFMTENLTNYFPGTYGSKSNVISVYLWVYPSDAGVIVAEQNLPWALNIDQSIPYTTEKTDFVTAYSNFFIWANSGGTNNADWYINKSGYRDTNKLYTKQETKSGIYPKLRQPESKSNQNK